MMADIHTSFSDWFSLLIALIFCLGKEETRGLQSWTQATNRREKKNASDERWTGTKRTRIGEQEARTTVAENARGSLEWWS